jgi:hypothetical protein
MNPRLSNYEVWHYLICRLLSKVLNSWAEEGSEGFENTFGLRVSKRWMQVDICLVVLTGMSGCRRENVRLRIFRDSSRYRSASCSFLGCGRTSWTGTHWQYCWPRGSSSRWLKTGCHFLLGYDGRNLQAWKKKR